MLKADFSLQGGLQHKIILLGGTWTKIFFVFNTQRLHKLYILISILLKCVIQSSFILQELFYLKDIALERERNREKEIEIFHPLVRSPNACSTQGWAQSEPGALLPPGPHVGGRNPGPQRSPAAFHVHQQRDRWGMEPLILEHLVISKICLFER